jgi:hypothetical protein
MAFKLFCLFLLLFFYSLFFIIIASLLFYALVVLMSLCCIPMVPYAVYSYYIYVEEEGCRKTTYNVLLVVLYPLWTAIGAVSYVIAMLLYPCWRSPSNHGLYDFFYDIYDQVI